MPVLVQGMVNVTTMEHACVTVILMAQIAMSVSEIGMDITVTFMHCLACIVATKDDVFPQEMLVIVKWVAQVTSVKGALQGFMETIANIFAMMCLLVAAEVAATSLGIV
mmetsp:Transcript_15345/g.32794  ORF Transcript_15345/g.32794 Transcript_15345/m.32794 type:complete len:109 (-) Transcript_15345:171-497(-)